MLRWRLMLTTLPYVAAVLVVKLSLERFFGFTGWLAFSDLGLVLTASAFLLGFMLSGVMADFKESEKLPGEIACTLETLEDHFIQAAVMKPGIDAVRLQQFLGAFVAALEDWLYRRVPRDRIHEALNLLLAAIQQLELAGAGPMASKSLGELHQLRKQVTRVSVISRTRFLQSGYALLDTLVGTTIGLLLISEFRTTFAECVLCSVVTLIYVYMVRLIRDLDDPFEYRDGNAGTSAADVDLFPILEYRQRLEARVAAAQVSQNTERVSAGASA